MVFPRLAILQMNAEQLLAECRERTIRLVPSNADLLWVDSPEGAELPPELEQRLTRAKPELLELLRSLRHTARQIIEGEFDSCSPATGQQLLDAMRLSPFDDLCSRAITIIKTRHHHSLQ